MANLSKLSATEQVRLAAMLLARRYATAADPDDALAQIADGIRHFLTEEPSHPVATWLRRRKQNVCGFEPAARRVLGSASPVAANVAPVTSRPMGRGEAELYSALYTAQAR